MSAIVAFLKATPPVFVPVAFLAILVSLFFDASAAIASLGLVSVMFAVVFGEPMVLPVWFLGGLVGVYGASRISRRTDITRLGLWVGLANLGAALAVGLVLNQGGQVLLSSLLWSLGSGLFASILVTVTLPYFETYFGITTDIRLLELADLNHPLLHRLSIEAPGTYHHSLTVATLAEAAARAVGAKPLLARIGALYHDVGKITRPHFFFENSGAHSRDYHDQVSANLSSVIIISHVKDGLELGRIFRLPEVVLDIISQHHGTSLIAYFYRKALMQTKDGETVDEAGFRYPGPRPRTKEAAVVMLADSVEADFRFSSWKSRKEIEARVRQVIENKLRDKQLDEVDLTLRDLHRIEQAFVRVLSGLVHTRSRYPEEMLANGKGKSERLSYVQQRPRS
jgi:putative nucleotidyltransferase with HDIG domain